MWKLNHRESAVTPSSQPLTAELLLRLGFTRTPGQPRERDILQLELPWCAAFAKTRTEREGSWLILVKVPGEDDLRWSLGFMSADKTLYGGNVAGCTLPIRLLETSADLEQLLFGLGYTVDLAEASVDLDIEEIKLIMLRSDFRNVQAYRHGEDTIRLRIEDAVFAGLPYGERELMVNGILDSVPNTKSQVTFMLLLHPGETATDLRLARLDYNFMNRRHAMARMPGE